MYKPDSEQAIFAQNIELFCRTNHLTHVDAAAFIGVPESTFNNWLRGRAFPNDEDKKRLEIIFRTTFKRICSSAITLRLLQDITYTIEDIFPYNCIISACNYGTSGTSVMEQYENSMSDDFDMDYKNITPQEFDNIFTQTLTYREQSVIQMRYRDNLTLEEVSKRFDLTRERIRQIEAKGLRKLYRSIRVLIKKKNGYDEKIEALTKEILVLQAQIDTQGTVPQPVLYTMAEVLKLPIEDMDFSVRTYNCLKRGRIETIKDIVTYKDNLLHIRNLGIHSLDEIIAKISELGLSNSYTYNEELHRFVPVIKGENT